jgi:hypothetical protein
MLYREEIDAYRRTGAKVCELTRLAIDPVHGSKEVLGARFHLAYIFGRQLGGITDVSIEANPRHVAFYRRCCTLLKPEKSYRQMLCMADMIRRRLFAAECCCPV